MSNTNNTVLVIGYGNDLRSDDGIGQRVAEKIACQNLSNVKTLAVHQLTPELAETLTRVDLVIFVDACLTCKSSDVQVRSLSPDAANFTLGHTSNPQALLTLTQFLYGSYPQAWCVVVPGENFELGDRLSPLAEKGIAIATAKIIELITQASC